MRLVSEVGTRSDELDDSGITELALRAQALWLRGFGTLWSVNVISRSS